jgi:hypothetical protein
MANVKGLVEAIQAVKSPNKHQVSATVFSYWPSVLPLRRPLVFSESRRTYAALFAIYQSRWPFPEMGGHLQGLAVLSVAALRGKGRTLQSATS